MHQETLLYIVHQLGADRKRGTVGAHEDHALRRRASCEASRRAGRRSGRRATSSTFGWDNEFERTEIDVAGFDIARYPVTNGDWLKFVADGGPVPEFWTERDGARFLRLLLGEIELPHSWPVYVTHRQATAYAKWAGMRLPTEARVSSRGFLHTGRRRAAISVGQRRAGRSATATSACAATTPSRSTHTPTA